MDPRSEVVLRQQDYLNGHILLINAPNDQLAKELPSQAQASVWTWNFAEHQGFLNAGISSHFSVEFPKAVFEQVIIFVPKSKELLNYILHVVVSHLQQGQHVFLVGEKKGGVERAAKQLQQYGQTQKLDSARHCQLWHMKIEKTEQLKPLDHWLKTYTVQVNQDRLEVCALPGVFSQDHLDIGTAVLVPYLDQVKSGKIADFGCGAGIISAYLAKLNPQQQIFALDIDAFALRSTEMTFQRNGLNLDQLHLQPVTGFGDAPKDLAAIVSNPPFHQGIHTDYDASETLCKLAKSHLKRSGELWIVANRFLNYQPLIEQSFGQCVIKTDQQGFKVLYASAKYKV
ncbi:ribosomal RNA small subunit methyltransferase C [Acinetobacter sp. CIP-A165]|uniref:methyltransferase n=1 Tax=Acinetobacter sp. CIP-A165 TaxID=40373 RepID=UPI0002CE175F|nr:methyltransferase [Acinetobacter sp. CIP-A165]ENU31115.1 ribosomal RNA small subunit methyltransferase C [Acinetobacter sp. CIP-A165]